MPSSREWYGRELLALARKDPAIVALDADLSRSTMSVYLERELPAQYYEAGIAEQNMMGIAAGMALGGLKPFVNSFAVFLTGRAYDQIRQVIAYPGLNVKLAGSSAGLSDFSDGATHQSVEDISLMRALPNMTVISPADHVQTRASVRWLAEYEGPAYLRISRAETDAFFLEDYQFRPGKVDRLAAGEKTAVICTGPVLGIAVEAVKDLNAQGRYPILLHASTIKPLDPEDLLAALGGAGRVITFEEHSIYGGLGSAVAEILAAAGGYKVWRLGIADRFGQSAHSYRELLRHYGLTAENLVRLVQAIEEE